MAHAIIEAIESKVVYLEGIELLNIGGEGETPGAVNLNSLEAPMRSTRKILLAGPLIVADMRNTGLPGDSVEAVIANMIAVLDMAWCVDVVAEQLRILKSGGTIRLSAWRLGEVWSEALRTNGFVRIRYERRVYHGS